MGKPQYARFELFTLTWGGLSRASAFQEAAEFATSIGPDRVFSISENSGCVSVWYWSDEPAPQS